MNMENEWEQSNAFMNAEFVRGDLPKIEIATVKKRIPYYAY